MRVDSCSSAIKSYAALQEQFNRATFLTAAEAAKVYFSRGIACASLTTAARRSFGRSFSWAKGLSCPVRTRQARHACRCGDATFYVVSSCLSSSLSDDKLLVPSSLSSLCRC